MANRHLGTVHTAPLEACEGYYYDGEWEDGEGFVLDVPPGLYEIDSVGEDGRVTTRRVRVTDGEVVQVPLGVGERAR